MKSNTPKLIGTSDELSTSIDLKGHEVHRSCGVTFQNAQYIFGGLNNKRQILLIDGCGLISVGSTPFDHSLGACSSTDEVIVLCFNYSSTNDAKRCRQASSLNGTWTELALSKNDHRLTSIATSPGTLLKLFLFLMNQHLRGVSGCRLL